MSFWESLKTASDLGDAFPWVIASFFLLSLFLAVFKAAERQRIRGTVLLVTISLAGLSLAAFVLLSGMSPLALNYRWLQWGSLLIQRIAFVNIAAIVLFEVLLDPLGLKPPHILRDLLLALSYVLVGITVVS